jgi:hypothetical protein
MRYQRRTAQLMEQSFNRRITQEMVVVEQTIGHLKIRYRRLDNLTIKIRKFEDAKKVIHLIDCACILHNFLKRFPGDNIPTDGDDNEIHDFDHQCNEPESTDLPSNNEERSAGSQRREEAARLIFGG